MEKIFCHNCGTKHEFKYAAPKFCSNCGADTTSLGGTTEKAEARSVPAPTVDRYVSRKQRKEAALSGDIDDGGIEVETTLEDIDRLIEGLGVASVKTTNNFESLNIGVPKNKE